MVKGKPLTLQVRSIPDDMPTLENRFGVSKSHALRFITAYKNQQIRGCKVCHRYPMTADSASIHADTFLWNIIDYKVCAILHSKILQLQSPTNY